MKKHNPAGTHAKDAKSAAKNAPQASPADKPRPHQMGPKSREKIDLVEEAGEESFPASDPPARTPVVGS